MSKPVADRIPPRFLPLAALVAGRPDAAALHLAGVDIDRPDMARVEAEVTQLRAEVAQLREELSVALEFVERLSAAATTEAS